MSIQSVIAEARTHAAERRAEFGHVPGPQDVIHRLVGPPLAAGESGPSVTVKLPDGTRVVRRPGPVKVR